MSLDAAELRRQKILKNSQNRLNLLMGVKNEDSESSLNAIANEIKYPASDLIPNPASTTTPNESSANTSTQQQEITHRRKNSNRVGATTEKSNILPESKIEDQVQTEPESSNNSTICKFNGYSNKEIVIFFFIALSTSLLFVFQKSDYIFQVIIYIQRNLSLLMIQL
jgi:hypothetical protein